MKSNLPSITFLFIILLLNIDCFRFNVYKTVYQYQKFCGVQNYVATSRVINGNEISGKVYPWMVLIKMNNVTHCTGTIITDQHFITAGHCFSYDPKWNLSDYRVYMNVDNLSETIGPFYENGEEVDSFHIPDGHNPYKHFNDIVLVKLKRKIKNFGYIIRPPCLPNGASVAVARRQNNRICMQPGWGYTNNLQFPDRPHEVQLNLYRQSECAGKFYNFQHSLEFCGGGNNSDFGDSCNGDSGASLICKNRYSLVARWEMIGIVNWGYKCSDGGVYAKVSPYIQWINRKLNV
ncbi:hypothetical protein SNEBB_004595 [Seison nebaliae]|nr:hypothetical protein SNEBB_004595 [Seison nebaliae]